MTLRTLVSYVGGVQCRTFDVSRQCLSGCRVVKVSGRQAVLIFIFVMCYVVMQIPSILLPLRTTKAYGTLFVLLRYCLAVQFYCSIQLQVLFMLLRFSVVMVCSNNTTKGLLLHYCQFSVATEEISLVCCYDVVLFMLLWCL